MESRPAGKGVFLLKERRENSVYCPGRTDNIGMGISYCAGSCTGRGHCFCMGIEQGLVLLELKCDHSGFHQVYGLSADSRGKVLQEFKSFLRIGQAGAQGGGIFESHPVKTGNTYIHTVLIDAWIHFYPDGQNGSSGSLCGICRGQGHTHWLSTAQGRHYLLL